MMKKIVTIASMGAFAVSAAFAATPKVATSVSGQPMKLDRSTLVKMKSEDNRAKGMVERSVLTNKDWNQTVNLADETPVEGSMFVQYVGSEECFYLGLTPSYGYWENGVGLTGIRNQFGFRNISTGAQSYEWTYRSPIGVDETGKDYLYDNFSEKYNVAENLLIPAKPFTQYETPELHGMGNGKTETFTLSPKPKMYLCGESFYSWGFTGSNIPEGGEITMSDVPGATTCPLGFTGIDATGFFSVNRTAEEKQSYLSNGTYKGWAEEDFLSYLVDGNPNVKLANPTTTGFAVLLPPKPSSYQLDAAWMHCWSVATEAVPMTLTIYGFTEDGSQIDYSKPLGRGEATLPAGEFPSKDGDEDLLTFYINAYDEDGYETDMPVVVELGESVIAVVEGFNNEAVSSFIMTCDGGTQFPVASSDAVKSYMYPVHAYAINEYDVTINGKTTKEVFETLCPYYYYTDEEMTTFWKPSDFLMFFDVYFPVVVNLDESSADYGTANFNVVIPEEGGTVTCDVFADYNIPMCLEDETMRSAATDWITYNQEFNDEDERNSFTQVTISADKLPEGTEGRQGYVVYSGLACDVIINVVQGTVAGIDSVVAAGKGAAEYFDLQGRKLSAAPSHGVYIVREGNKVSKRVAR